ncbi:hypothetical protein SprV_0100019800 [Sparganum proliferum]
MANSSTVNTDRTPEPLLPLSSIVSTSAAAAAPTTTTTALNPDAPANISLTTANTSDVNLVYTCPYCDRTFTSHFGLVGHLRIHHTETGKPVPEAPTYNYRICLRCPHCLRTFTLHKCLFGRMRIHEDLQ